MPFVRHTLTVPMVHIVVIASVLSSAMLLNVGPASVDVPKADISPELPAVGFVLNIFGIFVGLCNAIVDESIAIAVLNSVVVSTVVAELELSFLLFSTSIGGCGAANLNSNLIQLFLGFFFHRAVKLNSLVPNTPRRC